MLSLPVKMALKSQFYWHHWFLRLLCWSQKQKKSNFDYFMKERPWLLIEKSMAFFKYTKISHLSFHSYLSFFYLSFTLAAAAARFLKFFLSTFSPSYLALLSEISPQTNHSEGRVWPHWHQHWIHSSRAKATWHQVSLYWVEDGLPHGQGYETVYCYNCDLALL